MFSNLKLHSSFEIGCKAVMVCLLWEGMNECIQKDVALQLGGFSESRNLHACAFALFALERCG